MPETIPLREPRASATPSRPMGGVGALALLLIACLPSLALMCQKGHQAASLPVGVVSILLATLAVLKLLGRLGSHQPTEDEESVHEEPVHKEPSRLLWPAAQFLVACLALLLTLRAAVSGDLASPFALAGLLLTASFMASVITGFWVIQRLQIGIDRHVFNLFSRGGFWLVLVNSLLHLPLLGKFSLIDPWETHYGEVTREMLTRDDWISLWWAQDGWFWSKPVLSFWLQGLSFSALGVRFLPDQVLFQAGRFAEPEWALRFPVFLFALLAIYLLYKAVGRSFGKTTGLLSAFMLSCMPYWYLLARQAVTDMVYVAPLVVAMALLLLAVNTREDERIESGWLRVGSYRFEFSWFQGFVLLVMALVLPQALYLISRNFTLNWADFRPTWHTDVFSSGSGGGNCGLPGNSACHISYPLFSAPQPALAGLAWLCLLGYLLWALRRERGKQRLLFLFAWVAVALSSMAKGAPGFVIPVATLMAFALVTGQIRLLKLCDFPALLLLTGCITLPWLVQMLVRHGSGFTERLFWHDMYQRAFEHVHDTNANTDLSFGYYLWQLGYGLFPFSGLAAVGLGVKMLSGSEAKDARSQAFVFFYLWFFCAFGVFSLTLTKFHHYILPAVPPIAVLTALTFAPLLTDALPSGRRAWAYYAFLGMCALCLLGALGCFFEGSWLGRVPELKAPAHGIDWATSLVGLCPSAISFYLAYRSAPRPPEADPRNPELEPGGLYAGALILAGVAVMAAAGRDLILSVPGDVQGQSRLIALFTYIYDRPWPTSLDFSLPLRAFLVALVGVGLLGCVKRIRAHAFVLFCALGLMWAAFGINIYLTEAAQHWGQRSTVAAYYQHRKGPEEPLVAYQMNWKGENFYTGNQLSAFVTTGKAFQNYLDTRRNRGQKTLYIATEHSRLSALKGELGEVESFTEITTPKDNNKFLIVRVRL